MASRYWLKWRRASDISSHELPSKSRIAGFAMSSYNPFQFSAPFTFSRNKFRVSTGPSPLSHLVSNVVFISAYKKMFRILTNWVIAMMKDMQSLRYLAKVYNPTEPVGSNVSAKPKLSVFSRFSSPCQAKPSPAFINRLLVYFRPVSLNGFGINFSHIKSVTYSRRVI